MTFVVSPLSSRS